MTVVTSKPSAKPPALKENGRAVSSGFRAENLAAAKSVVLAVDRSRSMRGKPFADAVAAAQAFVRAKYREDRVAIATFATSPVMLTGFSAQPADAQSALGSLNVDAVEGTTLYDGIVKSAQVVRRRDEQRPSRHRGDRRQRDAEHRHARERDPRRPRGRRPRLRRRDREPPVQSRAAEATRPRHGRQLSRSRIERRARRVYAGIAAELRRTWRVEYLTSARPGDAPSSTPPCRSSEPPPPGVTIPGEAASKGRRRPGSCRRRRTRASSALSSWAGSSAPGASRRHLRAHLGPRLAPQEATRAAHRADGERSGSRSGAAPGRRRSLPGDRADVRPLAALGRPQPTARTQPTSRSARSSSSTLSCGAGLVGGLVAGILAQGTLLILAADGRRRHCPVARRLHQGQEADRRRSRTSCPTC